MNNLKLLIILSLCLFASCKNIKDPKDRTIWDYTEGTSANEEEYSQAIEQLHNDLINAGEMKPHSCMMLECSKNHTSTQGDIDRINKLVNDDEQ